MSEFRMFCIGFTVSAGLLAAAINHGFIPEVPTENWVIMAVFLACAAVALFGRRRAQ